ncbi:hypothetical protein JCM11641_001573 [Rhodosporidiobolus odoratus]
MRHGLRLPKLSRPTAHRNLMLRNLVSSLLEHQQITTTLAKAKAAQKLADQLIQWGKSGSKGDWERANAFLLNAPKTLRPLFTTLAQRYAKRPGGYTRIARAGYRIGDRAPLAVLELVDNRNDLKYEAAAKALGRELALMARPAPHQPEGSKGTWEEFRRTFEERGTEEIAVQIGKCGNLQEMTRKNVLKALQYRSLPVAVDAASISPSTPTSSTPREDADALLPPSSTSSEEGPSDHDKVVKTTHPHILFLERAHHHYLSSLASFSLASLPTSDPTRTIKQLTQRLSGLSFETKGAPKPVLTVPQSGRRERAGEKVSGWEGREHEPMMGLGAQGKGPISLAKQGKGRVVRFLGRDRKHEQMDGELKAILREAAREEAKQEL